MSKRSRERAKARAEARFPRCPFCQQRDAASSKEDIFANWIARLIQGEGKGIFKIVGWRHGQEPDQEWGAKGKIGFATRAPCELCNNRWMSSLETAVAPILTPMIQGLPTLVTTDQQLIIARWATKVAMNWEFFRRRDPRYFTHAERLALARQSTIPARTMFFLAHYREEAVVGSGTVEHPAGLVNEYDLVLEHTVEEQVVQFNAYVMTFAVGRLAVQLFSYRWPQPLTFHVRGKWDEAVNQIAPGTLMNLNWPTDAYMNDEVMQQFSNCWRNLSPVPHP